MASLSDVKDAGPNIDGAARDVPSNRLRQSIGQRLFSFPKWGIFGAFLAVVAPSATYVVSLTVYRADPEELPWANENAAPVEEQHFKDLLACDSERSEVADKCKPPDRYNPDWRQPTVSVYSSPIPDQHRLL